MQVDGGDNCHVFGDKHLFYILFVRPTSVHVDEGSTLSASDVGLVPVIYPGYPALHSLSPAYRTPTERINALSLSTLKLYSSFCGASHEPCTSCTFREYQGNNF